jgi:hemerythrin-like domain-containing protein
VDEPQLKAMFETSAEVLIGLQKAFTDYEWRNEAAWLLEEAGMASKRQFVKAVGLAGAGLAASVFAPAFITRVSSAQEKGAADKLKDGATAKNEPVTPPEDLVREHGVLDSALLVYEAAIAKFGANEDYDPTVVTQSAEIDYHEKSEEDYVFPRFRAARRMTDLVETLRQQHEAGRHLTQMILRFAPNARADGDDRRQLVAGMRSFITIYRPHAAREDTDLFPKLRDIVSANEWDSMAEDFERKEHQLFGDDGFEKMVQRVAQLERALGIHDLSVPFLSAHRPSPDPRHSAVRICTSRTRAPGHGRLPAPHA